MPPPHACASSAAPLPPFLQAFLLQASLLQAAQREAARLLLPLLLPQPLPQPLPLLLPWPLQGTRRQATPLLLGEKRHLLRRLHFLRVIARCACSPWSTGMRARSMRCTYAASSATQGGTPLGGKKCSAPRPLPLLSSSTRTTAVHLARAKTSGSLLSSGWPRSDGGVWPQ